MASASIKKSPCSVICMGRSRMRKKIQIKNFPPLPTVLLNNRCIHTLAIWAESKEKHGVWDPATGPLPRIWGALLVSKDRRQLFVTSWWDPMPELTITITSLYVHSRVYSKTFTMGNPTPESTLTLCQSRLYSQSGTLDLVSGMSKKTVCFCAVGSWVGGGLERSPLSHPAWHRRAFWGRPSLHTHQVHIPWRNLLSRRPMLTSSLNFSIRARCRRGFGGYSVER